MRLYLCLCFFLTRSLVTFAQDISCNFDDNECDFIQAKDDDFDWTRHRGPTPSRRTGPTADHAGDKAGYYMYIEASRKQSGDKARISRRVVLRGNACLSFYGHLFGSKRGMGTLNVLLDGYLVYTTRGNHGNEWQHFEEIPLPGKGSKMLVIEGIRGESYRGDIAIDDLLISECEEPDAHTPTDVPTPQEDCTFDTDECGFTQDTSDKFDWTRKTGPTTTRGTGPSGDHTGNQGYYMYIEATGRRSGDNAKMYRTVLLTGNSCLSLYVHMLGTNEDMGAFKIWLDGHPLFSLHQNYGERWQHFEGIPLLGNGKKLLVFEGIRGAGPKSDIAIDDVRISNCQAGGRLPPPTTPPPRAKPVSCGTSFVGRIVGGANAVRGEWPWQAMLRTSSGVPYCGGTLVLRQWVITAAHCVKNTFAGPVRVRLGVVRRIASAGGEQDFHAMKVIIHPNYEKPKMFANDIALLKLDRPADLNEYVNVACLPRKLPAPGEGQLCWITGWGKVNSSGPVPDILQQVQVPVVGKARCAVAYPNLLHISMMCAGSENGGIDSCQGDSGGPMVCHGGGSGGFVLYGVTSWGHGCAAPGMFGVYANVKHLMGWIDKEIAINQ